MPRSAARVGRTARVAHRLRHRLLQVEKLQPQPQVPVRDEHTASEVLVQPERERPRAHRGRQGARRLDVRAAPLAVREVSGGGREGQIQAAHRGEQLRAREAQEARLHQRHRQRHQLHERHRHVRRRDVVVEAGARRRLPACRDREESQARLLHRTVQLRLALQVIYSSISFVLFSVTEKP